MRNVYLILILAVAIVLPFTQVTFAQESLISPEELYNRMRQNAQIQARTGYGKFARRVYNDPQLKSEAERRAEIDETIKQITASAEKLQPRERQKRLSQIPDIRLSLEKQSKSTLNTTVQAYYVSGSKHRTETWAQSNEDPLDAFRGYEFKLDVESASVDVWNGQYTARLTRMAQSVEEQPHDLLILTSDKPRPLDFLAFGREVPDNLLDTFREQGHPICVESTVTKDGEEALILRIGEKGTIGFLLETVVLPNKGYSIAESSVMMYGAPQVREEYSDFVQTSAGFWVPMKIRREAYKLSEHKVPVLSSRLEMIALEEPKVNVSIDDKLFDLTPTSTTLMLDHRLGQNVGYLVPGVNSKEGALSEIFTPDESGLTPEVKVTDKTVASPITETEAETVQPGSKRSDESKDKERRTRKEEQARVNLELVIKPIIVGLMLTLGFLGGMWLLKWRKKQIGSVDAK